MRFDVNPCKRTFCFACNSLFAYGSGVDELALLGRVALGAQRPIFVKLSRGQSVGRSVSLSVGLSSALWKNHGSDPAAVWHHRSDGSGYEAGSGFGDRST